MNNGVGDVGCTMRMEERNVLRDGGWIIEDIQCIKSSIVHPQSSISLPPHYSLFIIHYSLINGEFPDLLGFAFEAVEIHAGI